MRTNKFFVVYVLSNFKWSLYCVVCEACYFADRNFGYAAKASASAAVVSAAAAIPTAAAVPAAAVYCESLTDIFFHAVNK